MRSVDSPCDRRQRSAYVARHAGIVSTGASPIVVIREPGRVPLQLVVRSTLDVGRDCDGVLLTDPELSRRHLRVSTAAGLVTVQDLDSTNGTTLDGARLVGPTAVRVGQVVAFGRCRLEVLVPDPRAGSPGDRMPRSGIEVVAAAAADRDLTVMLRPDRAVTVVFSDVEQAARLAARLGDDQWGELVGFHASLVRRHLERAGGAEVMAEGGCFMVLFPTALGAVRYAIEIMRSLAVHRRSRPTEAVRVRIGMHTGEAGSRETEPIGDPAALAAHITTEARAGEILVSSVVREIVEVRGETQFGQTRHLAVDGFTTAHALHPVDWSVRVG
jgi:class 3 adenylate cyclase